MANSVKSELTGEQIDTSSESYRHECEVRWVLSIGSLQARREYIEKIERKRGKPAADKLRQDGLKMFEIGRRKPIESPEY